MKTNNKLMFLTVAVILIVAMSVPVLAASEPTYAGEMFPITFRIITQYAETVLDFVDKSDASSHYLYHTGDEEIVAVRSYGAVDDHGNSQMNMTYANGQSVNAVYVQTGNEYRIQNLVYEVYAESSFFETNTAYCTLAFFPATFSGTLEGFWHPNCTDTSLPPAPDVNS